MKQAMILAAGLGTRLKPLTDRMPKAMVPVGDKPLLWHLIMKLKRSGFERIVINVHHFADQIIDYVKDNSGFGVDMLISDERDILLDTGGGLRKALPLFDDESPVLIHNVDIFSNVDLGAFYEKAASTDALLLVSNLRSATRPAVRCRNGPIRLDKRRERHCSMCSRQRTCKPETSCIQRHTHRSPLLIREHAADARTFWHFRILYEILSAI